jgi:uncharacterized membrane protein
MKFIEKLAKLLNPEALGYAGVFEQFVQVHIIFGLISLISGIAILILNKGTLTHKRIGRIFVGVMLGSFLLGVPLGSLGQLTVGEPANFMTVIGAILVGGVTYSGFRLARAGVSATAWHDKAALGIIGLAGLGYFYVAALLVAGTNLFGLGAFSLTGEPFTLLDNKFNIAGQGVVLVGTSIESIFAVIISENFVTPLFLGSVAAWFVYQDWHRIRGTKSYARPRIIEQHYTRLLVVFSAAISAVLLNIEWLSFWLCWGLPSACALIFVFFYGAPGRTRVKALRGGTFFSRQQVLAKATHTPPMRTEPPEEKSHDILK